MPRKMPGTLDGTEQNDGTYSDAGSGADLKELYADVLHNELLQDLESLDLASAEDTVSRRLEEFAIRLAH